MKGRYYSSADELNYLYILIKRNYFLVEICGVVFHASPRKLTFSERKGIDKYLKIGCVIITLAKRKDIKRLSITLRADDSVVSSQKQSSSCTSDN